MEKMLFAGLPRLPKFPNDLHFSTCFRTYYCTAFVKYSGYLVLSWWSWGKKYQKVTKKSTSSYKSTLFRSFTALKML